MKHLILTFLMSLSIFRMSATSGMTKEVFDSITNLYFNIEYIVSDIYDSQKVSVIKDVNKENFYSMPDSARFWTYDLLEGKTYAHIKTFNYKRGLYKITARDSCSGTSYFVLFRNYEYEIFDWVDEELLKKVASLLNEANTDETVKRKVYEELERYRKRQGFMY